MRDNAGAIVFLAEVCSNEVDRASVTDVEMYSRASDMYQNSGTESDEDAASDLMRASHIQVWAGRSASGRISVPFLRGRTDGADWKRRAGGSEPRKGVRYSFGARDADSAVTLTEVEFTLAEIDALVPGEVRGFEGRIFEDAQKFREAACS